MMHYLIKNTLIQTAIFIPNTMMTKYNTFEIVVISLSAKLPFHFIVCDKAHHLQNIFINPTSRKYRCDSDKQLSYIFRHKRFMTTKPSPAVFTIPSNANNCKCLIYSAL